VAEFWQITLWELRQVVEADNWRARQEQQRDVALAWRTASLMRAKRLPSLKRLLVASKPARPLRGKELAERRQAHRETVDRMGEAAQAILKKRGLV
jgi:hypothetical protein